MAETPSKMIPLGTKAPDFRLPDTISGKMTGLNDISSEIGTVVMFICNHCPFVKHINSELVNLSNEYLDKGISFVAINSNDVSNYPEDSPDNMKKYADALGYRFPYLYDESQNVARAFAAACTPDFFVYDGILNLVYRGQFDSSRPGNGVKVTGKDLRSALDCLIEGKVINPEQIPSIGCNIKWRR